MKALITGYSNFYLNFEVRHIRNKDKKGKITQLGGTTVLFFPDNKGNKIYTAKCHPKDKYCKRMGILIGLYKVLSSKTNYMRSIKKPVYFKRIQYNPSKYTNFLIEVSTDKNENENIFWWLRGQ
jgi:hypothetical protein